MKKYDVPARKIIKEKLGENVEDNPDIYHEDMLLNIPECKYNYLELQVCTKWISDKYPYRNPFVLCKKKIIFSEYIIFNF